MTKFFEGDWERTKEVVSGKRPSVESGETWLRHHEGTSAYEIDLLVLRGTSSVEEIARAVKCPINRVISHMDHLQEKKDTKMEPHHLKIKRVDGKVLFDYDHHPSTAPYQSKLDTAQITSHSWTIESRDIACKVLDKSAFMHWGTGIPIAIRPFFIKGKLQPGERRNITIWYEGKEYPAHVDLESIDTARTRLFWNAEFSSLLHSMFPHHYQQYSNDIIPESKIIIRFTRISGYAAYQVSFAGEVTEEKAFSDIQAEELEDKGPQKEGAVKEYFGKRYERSPVNRLNAIQLHGLTCNICGFNFEATYGERGADFIEVHHVKPISTFEKVQQVDPKNDLITVCSNCHRMIHRRPDDVLTVQQVKALLACMRKQ